MVRFALSFILCFAASAAFAASPEEVPLVAGDTTIRFPVEPGTVRISEQAPDVFRFLAAALPPGSRLIEAFYTRADLARIARGEPPRDVYGMVQTLKIAESKQIGIADWRRIRSGAAASIRHLDLKAEADQDVGRRARMSEATGRDVDLALDKVDAPRVYLETPTSLRFDATLASTLKVDDQSVALKVATAGAIVLVRNRILNVGVHLLDPSPAGRARVRAALDGTVERLVALNPSDPAMSSSPDVRMGVFLPFSGRDIGLGLAALCAVGAAFAILLFFLSRRRVPRA